MSSFFSFLDRMTAGDIIRVGAHHSALWTRNSGVWGERARVDMPMDVFQHNPLPGTAGLQTLMASRDRQRRLRIVAESACMPVCFLRTSGRLWRSEQIHAMARHRMVTLYGDRAHEWALQTTYLLGDDSALAFALPARFAESVRLAADREGCSDAVIQPALAWGWDRCIAKSWHAWLDHRSSRRTFWWVWPEQDRELILLVEKRKIVGLNPCVQIKAPDESALRHALDLEAARLGVAQADRAVRVFSWEGPDQTSLKHSSVLPDPVTGIERIHFADAPTDSTAHPSRVEGESA